MEILHAESTRVRVVIIYAEINIKLQILNSFVMNLQIINVYVDNQI